MPARILIKVLRSADGGDADVPLAPVTDATVSYVPEALIRADAPRAIDQSGLEPFWEFDFQPETYRHVADGHYEPDPDKSPDAGKPNPALDPEPGRWLLVVQADGRTPVSQRLTLSEKGPRLIVKPGWNTVDKGLSDAQATAETVHIVNYSKGTGPNLPATNVLITVTLFPRSEVVFMAGFDGGGTRFIRFAETRRLDLHKQKKTDAGTRSAFFDAADGTRKLFVKAKSGWVAAQAKRPNLPVSPTPPETGPDRRMGIFELYRYLHQMGFEAPGTIQEVGIFSHAFAGGPVLWNTFDRSDQDVNRDPKDIDGRAKDWQAPGTMQVFQDLVKSLRNDAAFRIWGCHFDPTVTAKIKAANDRGSTFPRDQFFQVTAGEITENVSLDVMRHQFVIDFSGTPLRLQVYCAAGARHIQRSFFGTPPGTGANFVNLRMVPEATGPIYTYLGREFGLTPAARDDVGYMDYLSVVNTAAPPPAYATQHFGMGPMKFHNTDLGDRKFTGVRLPSKCAILRLDSAPPPAGLPFVVEAQTGLVDPALSGHLYIAERATPEAIREIPKFRLLFIQGSPNEDCSVYVQSDRRFFVMRRDRPSLTWRLDTRPIRLLKQIRAGEAFTDDPAAPPTTITDGLFFFDSQGIHW